ncbi:hypothetical protein HGRIS_012300 [Hohenbuehelia grisea]|uniref:F-box domain-containing protein n=1 Tax=Hohenbuehelia grisea TaxID=104357 RepID=A0ABR3IRV1_9AGAR
MVVGKNSNSVSGPPVIQPQTTDSSLSLTTVPSLQTTSNSPISKLPIDVLADILALVVPTQHFTAAPLEEWAQFGFVGTTANFWRDRTRIASVCSVWYAVLALNTPFPDASVSLELLTSMHHRVLETPGRKITVAALARPYDTEIRNIQLPLVYRGAFSSLGSRVDNLNLELGFDFNNATAVDQYFNWRADSLRFLTLTGVRVMSNNPAFTFAHPQIIYGPLFQGHTPQLTQLVLKYCLLPHRSSFLLRLTSLTLLFNHGAPEPAIYDLLAATPTLQVLQLFWSLPEPEPGVEDYDFRYALPSLRTLRIADECGMASVVRLLARLIAPPDITLEILWSGRQRDGPTVPETCEVMDDFFVIWRAGMHDIWVAKDWQTLATSPSKEPIIWHFGQDQDTFT